MVVMYGCCVGSWDRFNRNVVLRATGPVMALSGQTSIAKAYNKILKCALVDVDALILLHDDLEITDPDAEAKFLAALEDPSVGLVGVAGGGGDQGLAWWNREPIGHQQIDSGMIDFGVRSGEVELLEGSILVLSPYVIRTVWFDQTLEGFHGYDEIGAQVREHGKKVVVVDVDTHHHTQLGFTSEASQAQWQRGDQLYREKWA